VAEVFATGSAASQAYIKRLGAVPIDYRAMTVENYVAKYSDGRGFDIVYDTVGGATLDASSMPSPGSAMSSARLAGARMRWRRCRFAPRATRACSRCCPC